MQVWEGRNVVSSGRKLIGATRPWDAEIGTIRGMCAASSFGLDCCMGQFPPCSLPAFVWCFKPQNSTGMFSRMGSQCDLIEVGTISPEKSNRRNWQCSFSVNLLLSTLSHACVCSHSAHPCIRFSQCPMRIVPPCDLSIEVDCTTPFFPLLYFHSIHNWCR